MLKVIKIFIKRTCIYMEQGQRFLGIFRDSDRYFNVMYSINVIIIRWRNFFRVIIFSGSVVKLVYYKF